MTYNLLMIRPARFAYNAETAVNNSFQVAAPETAAIQAKALSEFDGFVEKLIANGIDVTIVQDTPEPHTPDSIFPNNWVSFHSDGTVFLYPMFAKNRRPERKQHVLDAIQQKFIIKYTTDLSVYEQNELFLEGTGSMVLDRENKMAYACLSPRTSKVVLKDFCRAMNYTPITFTADDEAGNAIYHTNVMMCVADKYAVICLSSVRADFERAYLKKALESSGKEIIDISFSQMNHFASNMLQVQNKEGNPFLVMSTQAFESLNTAQITTIEKYNPIIHSDIATIEANGGGSARCMMAEIYLPVK
ncbi:citrulline utilization hydrolase CtlX [Parasediminibacterium sp. JCM 36343]|uniref:citrulline utilization hydrolase CtlX n=1 Tax=Parasediminibacterium sp. JCM 36343 TaxID=3374279 RepID=UPI003978718B